jgi:laccase
VLNVERGKTYLLRDTTVHEEYNLKIAGHKFIVVAVDANYVKPHTTHTIVTSSGETVDTLLVADAPPGRYYMVAQAVQSPELSPQIPVLITRGIVSYYSPSNQYDDDTPIVAPQLPDQHDATPSFYFRGNLTRLLPQPVPTNVDEHLLIAIDVGDIYLYAGSPNCMVSKLNNISFELPTTPS